MPTIGRPELNNPFTNIKMKPAEPQSTLQAQDPKAGDTLNKLAGVKPEQRFVDRKTHDQLGPDGFMKLLAHQLKNQDPLKPMDQKDFSANLAQFSQLEQMTSMNKKMDAFSSNSIAEKKFQGASFIGKRIVSSGTSIDFKGDGKDVELPFFIDKPAKNMIIHIYDNKNQMIGKIDKQDLQKGMQTVTWDGIGLDGQLAPKETYHFDVVAYDDQNQKFMGATRSEGTVTGVNFENGETVFTTNNGRKVFLRDVDSFSTPEIGTGKNSDGKNIPALQKQAASAYNQVENQN
jgi:flagellar basal-body rod modification protein FlgD